MKGKVQKITVAGLLVLDDKVLVVRRSQNESYLPGYYELPGGKVDFEERPETSLEREFLEEVNLHVKTSDPYRVFTYVSDKGKRHTVEIVFLVELKDDIKNIKLSKAHDAFKWVSREDVDKINMSDEIRTNIIEGFNKFKSEWK